MSDFSAALKRRAGMGGSPMESPGGPPPGMGGPPSGGGLAQVMRAANQALAQAIQSGEIPPEAMMEIQKFATLIAQYVQSQGNRGPQGPPQGAPQPAPQGAPQGMPA